MNDEQDPPDTWEARLAYAEELHAYLCRLDPCHGRDWHEQERGVSFMAGVVGPRAGSAYGVPPELAEYRPPDFAAPVASAPAGVLGSPLAVQVRAHAVHVLAFLALCASLTVEIAGGQVVIPGVDVQAVTGALSPKVVLGAHLLLVVAAAYGIKPKARVA